ncbi:hypothetical protein NW756_002251 [Fusarium oxysporum]|nr:hypothetical protein NW753_000804 [Fusarium oxysporum]KAJ4101823.1 hypothetical protein NW756_002251 [Fusarium oxysporum]KAJ4242073.1 hypothetical protein NW760_000285 [Fusarium oxysporum]
MQTEQLTQVHLGDDHGETRPISQQNFDVASFSSEEARFQEKLLNLCPANLWPKASYMTGCPRPVLVGQYHQQQLKDLHEALTAAITDVVQRWWSDKDAGFPERMPLEDKEEELLQWIEGQVMIGNLPQFSQCRGSWRPDFLVEDNGERKENYCITEINARFSFNGFMHEAYGQAATNESLESAETVFMPATDPDTRMLGIVRQEIPQLVTRGVVTAVQAEALRLGIVETLIPGSKELNDLLHKSVFSPDVRHDYILKPIRSGKGQGIIFGEDVTAPEWASLLQALTSPGEIPAELCVLQRRITPRKYNLMLRASEGMVRYPLVGTYHVTNGELLGLGTWRASGGRIVAVASGGSWICSVMKGVRDVQTE